MKKMACMLLVLVTCLGVFAPMASAAQPIKDEVYYIISALDEKKAVDVSGASCSDGANVQLYSYNETGAQKFRFTYKNGYYTITNVNSKKVLDAQGGGTTSGTNVWQYSANNTDAQKWQVLDLGNGYYSIRAKCGLYLDVQGANTSNGTNIQLYSGNGTKAQIFKLVPLVKYTYKTVTLDCSSVEAWKASTINLGKYQLANELVVAQNVLSYKKVKVRVPLVGPYLEGQASYKTVTMSLPYQVEMKLHTHTMNKGFGRNWYYTNGGIQMLETCSCGYRNEGLFWKIPKLTDQSVQTTAAVISQLPQF